VIDSIGRSIAEPRDFLFRVWGTSEDLPSEFFAFAALIVRGKHQELKTLPAERP
jgi:hypothetical protein